MNPLENISLTCPWCGSPTDVLIDCSANNQVFVEDCSVCCQPMVVRAEFEASTGVLTEVSAIRENE